MPEMYDALVVGAGPGGATTAAFLARAGRRVLLVDKETFPRDKVCGDALSGKTADVLRRLGLVDAVRSGAAISSWGIVFSGPYGAQVSIPFGTYDPAKDEPGFVMARLPFDDLVFNAAKDAGAEVWEDAQVTGLLRDDAGRVAGATVKRNGETADVHAKIVVGADGAYSVVAKDLGFEQLDERHYCGGLRAYYEGVTGFEDHGFIELHFVSEAIPGYFWIFPMANGGANVGIGMLSQDIKKKDIKLKPLLDFCIDHPRFKDRFTNATRVGKVQGWGLPLGSKGRPLSGDGWLLVGDAGSLIDPFSGEGIGNAMISGEMAANWIGKALDADDFSPSFFKGYDADVLAYLGTEFRLSRMMQQLGRWKWLLNFVIDRASKSKTVAAAISAMFADENERAKFANPLFYLKLAFAK
ncbi:MAG: geranylgeranyl reductase family protein [Bacteroidetes bacterium]|nr:geranylgeranyl reductase family protein [Bacteroidota bacterium]